ncbi:AAA family ATPase [Streptomyces sp. NPDC048577]|uniref:AAA family ATPase n=1 Tax=Streptomyces sp. NPDC048577 TaxID=3157209 RepID=UPI0034225F6F
MTEEQRHAVLSLGIALERTEDGSSPRLGLDPLEQAPRHSEDVVAVLGDFRYEPLPPPGEGPVGHLRQVESAVVSQDVDVLIVHLVGHGELAEERSEKLYVLDGDGRRLARPVASWIELIEDHPDEHRPMTLFILDVCYAGEPAVRAWHGRMDVARRRAWVLAATGPRDTAFGYRLSRAVVRVLEKYRNREVRFDPSVRYIPPGTFFREIDRTVNDLVAEAPGNLPQSILTSLVPAHADLSGLPFFPNPSYGEPAADGLPGDLPPEIARLTDWAWDPEHFMRRGGGGEPVGRDWGEGYFSGREEELGELSAWLDGAEAGPRVRMVTGKPGSGKSALLGVLVCAAHPLLRRHTRRLWHRLDGPVPGENDRLAVVHARRLGLDQITAALARQLRPGSPAEEPGGAANPADHLYGLLPEEGAPVTVVLDALDEADRPEDIVAALLLPLAQRAREPGSRLRLLVSTREDARFRPLFDLACDDGGHTDLSGASPDTVRRGVAAYVERLLRDDGPYARGSRSGAREALARAVAERLVGRGDELQWGEFLAAGLYVHYLLAAEEPRDTPEEAAALGARVPLGLPELLELDLMRHSGEPRLRPLLTGLAFAQGRGMPERVLASAASAFTGSLDAEPPLPPAALHEVLDRTARFYLRREVDEDGTTLYRLFHEGLAQWLQANAVVPAGETGEAGGAHPVGDGAPAGHSVTGALYARLLESVPRDGTGRRLWHLAAPYLWRHTARHALDAGRLDDLVRESEFLLHADPHALADALRNVGSERARHIAAVYRASWGTHHTLPPSGRRQLLALDAARFRDEELRASLPGDADWSVRWATGHQVTLELVRTLVGHDRTVTSVAVTAVGGRVHAVTGSTDRTARVWDLTTGRQVGTLVGGHGEVAAVAVAEVDGRPHALTAGQGPAVRVWDLSSGRLVRELRGHTGPVTAVVVTWVDGRPHALTGSQDRWVRMWDLTTGEQTQLVGRHSKMVISLAVTELDGRPHVVVSDRSGAVSVWDLVAAYRVRELSGHRDWVVSSATAVVDGTPQALTTDTTGTVRVYDLVTGRLVGELTGHTKAVDVVTVTTLDGRPHALTGDRSGAVRVWDLTTRRQVRVLIGHTKAVAWVTAATMDGRPHALTGGHDGTVRVWDLTARPETSPLRGRTDRVDAVAVAEVHGAPYALTGERAGALRLWDVAGGRYAGELSDHGSAIQTVAVTTVAGRPHALAVGIDPEVRMWDLTTRTPAPSLVGHESAVVALAVTELDGRPHAVTASHDRTVRVWDLTTASETGRMTGHKSAVISLAVTRVEGVPVVLTGTSRGTVEVWDLTTKTRIRTLTGRGSAVIAVAATEVDGRPLVLVSRRSGKVDLWNPATCRPAGTLSEGHAAVPAVSTVTFDGRPCAVTAGLDRTVRLWDLGTRTCVSTFHLPDEARAVTVGPGSAVLLGVGHEVVALSLEPLARRLG